MTRLCDEACHIFHLAYTHRSVKIYLKVLHKITNWDVLLVLRRYYKKLASLHINSNAKLQLLLCCLKAVELRRWPAQSRFCKCIVYIPVCPIQISRLNKLSDKNEARNWERMRLNHKWLYPLQLIARRNHTKHIIYNNTHTSTSLFLSVSRRGGTIVSPSRSITVQ